MDAVSVRTNGTIEDKPAEIDTTFAFRFIPVRPGYRSTRGLPLSEANSFRRMGIENTPRFFLARCQTCKTLPIAASRDDRDSQTVDRVMERVATDSVTPLSLKNQQRAVRSCFSFLSKRYEIWQEPSCSSWNTKICHVSEAPFDDIQPLASAGRFNLQSDNRLVNANRNVIICDYRTSSLKCFAHEAGQWNPSAPDRFLGSKRAADLETAPHRLYRLHPPASQDELRHYGQFRGIRYLVGVSEDRDQLRAIDSLNRD